MIPSNHKSGLADIVKNFVVRAKADVLKTQGNIKAGDLAIIMDDFCEELKHSTGLRVGVKFSGNPHSLDLGTGARINLVGVGSSRYTSLKEIRDAAVGYAKLDEATDLEVDLTQLKIKGSILKKQSHVLYIPLGLFNPRFDFTVEEVTASLLHEIGHMFSFYINMGDYVWLNLYLTDGIEILQGNKRTTVKAEIFTEQWLRKNLTKEELGDFVYGKRNDHDAKRVALIAGSRLPRFHIVNSPLSGMVREEQFADLFSSRLGYARPLATFFYKLNKVYGISAGSTGTVRLLTNLLTVAVCLPWSPFVMLSIMLERLPSDHLLNPEKRYDNDRERLAKLKRDLIAQMKLCERDEDKMTNINDVKIIENLMLDMPNGRTLYGDLVTFFRPSFRKAQQNQNKEEILESLVNNDLFIKATLTKIA